MQPFVAWWVVGSSQRERACGRSPQPCASDRCLAPLVTLVTLLLHYLLPLPGTCGRSRGALPPSSLPRVPSCASARRPPRRTVRRRRRRRRRRPSPAAAMPLGSSAYRRVAEAHSSPHPQLSEQGCPCGGLPVWGAVGEVREASTGHGMMTHAETATTRSCAPWWSGWASSWARRTSTRSSGSGC